MRISSNRGHVCGLGGSERLEVAIEAEKADIAGPEVAVCETVQEYVGCGVAVGEEDKDDKANVGNVVDELDERG